MEDWRVTTLDGPEMSDERLIEVMKKAAEEHDKQARGARTNDIVERL